MQLKTVSSQYKHLPERGENDFAPYLTGSEIMLKNDTFSFQALCRADDGCVCLPVSVSAVCGGVPVEAWRVDYAPVIRVGNVYGEKGFESDKPGALPDILSPRPSEPVVEKLDAPWNNAYFEKDTDNLINITGDMWIPVWFTLNPHGETLTPGKRTITVKMTSLADPDDIVTAEIPLEVADEELPEQDVFYTNWFHCDCLCDLHHVELYSDEFYTIFDEYIRNMTEHRQNTLLLPAFTPPLDTPIGSERMNVQLVDISRENGEWKFGFDRMRIFIEHADKCGIKWFEHCHLFSQWGAYHAPNIYLSDGTRIFGQETDASGEEYSGFIRAYLTAFLAFAKEVGIEKRLIFHISDEPVPKQLESYAKAVGVVRDLLDGYLTADAMSHIDFWEKGLVGQPVVDMPFAENFFGKCPDFWVYYTGGYYEKNSANRLITNTAARTRVLGVQMWYYGAKGFLHWGYNYCYDRLSAGMVDPRVSPNGYKLYAGDCCLPYPTVTGGRHVVPSIREKLMGEAFDDLRALKLLEKKIGREETLKICEETLGGKISNTLIPDADTLHKLRNKVNRLCAER